MDMKLLCGIRNFKLDSIDDYRTMDGYTISSNYEMMSKLFHTDDFLKKAGILSAELEFEGTFFAVRVNPSIEIIFGSDKVAMTNKLTEQALFLQNHLRHLMHFLWFIKDNSVSPSICMGYIYDRPELGKGTFVRFSEISIITNCYGEMEDVTFTKEDIDKAHTILNKYRKICPGNPMEVDGNLNYADGEEITPKLLVFKGKSSNDSYNDKNRVQRAFDFLSLARLSHLLIMKIALFIPVLECLFSGEQGELTQKVSERVAFYLGKTRDQRYLYFETIKDGYNLRSRYIHGDKLEKKHLKIEFQMDLSKKLDEICRLVLYRIIMDDFIDFLQDEDSFRLYLKKLIFLPDCETL